MQKSKGISSKNKWPYLFITPYFLSYAVLSLFPILFTLYISLTDWDLYGNRNFIGFSNYTQLFFHDAFFWKSLLNVMIFMAVYLPALVLMGMLVASLIESKLIRRKTLFRLSVFSAYMTTPVAVGIIFSLLFDWQGGFFNNMLMELGIIQEKINWLGSASSSRWVVILMVFWKNLGYFVMFYTAGMASIDTSIYEAAVIDGASSKDVFTRITIPLLKPINLFLIITSIISGLQLVEEPMLLFSGWASGSSMVGGPDGSTFTPIWYMFDASFNGSAFKYGKGAAIAYGTFLFIALFSVVGMKWINRGGDDK
ncbi:binding-protein-dependent transport system inner membrane protein [Paenibacillus sp. FSL R7-277]|uniref:Multiple sugar transport system permease protein/cellobiose transport system permease protein n=1 Tax=Paenibacillus silagei TaxID=1670801 RepID=A0ABS4NVN4_9BACL|nr:MULTISPECIES: sugar ABC transporter permease [Paenibacillus]ETT65184.1 binding-protein-dependent transport system inner membrane protein [Paenibacillus sp. FSL R7-277]MBP2114124.1 multiple sugar transport system permease protein/cellobiose transport system permease protein [Paenibacillus silagei]